jgi:hypothetical protein
MGSVLMRMRFSPIKSWTPRPSESSMEFSSFVLLPFIPNKVKTELWGQQTAHGSDRALGYMSPLQEDGRLCYSSSRFVPHICLFCCIFLLIEQCSNLMSKQWVLLNFLKWISVGLNILISRFVHSISYPIRLNSFTCFHKVVLNSWIFIAL